MKYLPLVWAALRRKPIRTGVTFLSVTVAFTLFGLMIGLGVTMDLMEQRARADRIWTNPRFDNSGLPIAAARQIANLPGVKSVTGMSYLPGYVADPKNRLWVTLVDGAYGRIYPDWGVTPQQWDMIRRDRTAVVMSRMQANLFHKKVGDTLTVISPETIRADGAKSWTFKVVAIGEDIPMAPAGYNFGNYDYFDKAVPLAAQGRINELDLLAVEPDQASALAERIDGLFASSTSPTLSMTEKSAYSISNNFGGMDVKAVTRDIALAGLLMILYLTASVIAESVRERRAEFATLKTIGFSDTTVSVLVGLEAALPCVAGAFCGVALAAWLAGQLPAIMPPTFGIPTPVMSPAVFAWAQLGACAVALASSVLPVLRLRRMDIASALSGRA
jgi:putative ABC transport system permease protein